MLEQKGLDKNHLLNLSCIYKNRTIYCNDDFLDDRGDNYGNYYSSPRQKKLL